MKLFSFLFMVLFSFALAASDYRGAVKNFKAGQSFYLDKEYKMAMGHFSRASKLSSKIYLISKYNVALCLIKLKRDDSAIDLLMALYKLNPPVGLKTKMDSAIKVLLKRSDMTSKTAKKTKKTKRLSISLNGAVGINSNPTFENSSTLATTESSSSGRGRSSTTIMNTSDVETQLAANISYKAIKTNSFTTHLSYRGYTEFYQKNDSYNFATHDLSIPLNYYLKSMRFQLIPLYSYQELGGEAYLNSKGGKIVGIKRFDNFDLSLFYSQYNVGSMDSNYDYLEGDSTSLGVNVLIPTESSEFNISYRIIKSDTRDSLENIGSYDGYKAALSYYYSQSTYSWYISAGLGGRSYKRNPTTGLSREDKENIFIIRPTYNINRNLSIYMDNKLINVDSTESDRGYDQFTSMIGFTWYIW